MKHTNINDYATKKDLNALEKRIEAKIDAKIDNLDKKFDEKLTKRLNDSFEAFRQENAYQFQMMREELQATMSAFTNRILTAMDPLMKNLQTREQESAILAAQMKHTQDDVVDLQKRITKLELADK